jgi:pimeloyl-ACP methyl ester carboxylesterase
MADDAFAVAKYVFPNTRYMVMGVSMGGMIAQTLLVRQPQFVERLILVSISSFLLPPSAQYSSSTLSMIYTHRAVHVVHMVVMVILHL